MTIIKMTANTSKSTFRPPVSSPNARSSSRSQAHAEIARGHHHRSTIGRLFMLPFPGEPAEPLESTRSACQAPTITFSRGRVADPRDPLCDRPEVPLGRVGTGGRGGRQGSGLPAPIIRSRWPRRLASRQSGQVALTEDEFVRALVEAIPEVQPILDEHLTDNDELLLHPFVARVRDFAIDAFDNGKTTLSDGIVAILERGMRDGDEGVENAVAVSFIEDTPWWDTNRQAFIDSWPPALRAEAERQRNWRP